jgi:hypothetical protein
MHRCSRYHVLMQPHQRKLGLSAEDEGQENPFWLTAGHSECRTGYFAPVFYQPGFAIAVLRSDDFTFSKWYILKEMGGESVVVEYPSDISTADNVHAHPFRTPIPRILNSSMGIQPFDGNFLGSVKFLEIF